MTAAELYEIVKGDPEVWNGWVALDKGKFSSLWRDLTSGNVLCSPLAEIALEGLYTSATGCGVVEFGGDYMAYDLNGNRGRFYGGHPTRLAALVAAYRAKKENKR